MKLSKYVSLVLVAFLDGSNCISQPFHVILEKSRELYKLCFLFSALDYQSAALLFFSLPKQENSGIITELAIAMEICRVILVGKDALAEGDKITLETAKLLREDYLAQNAFTPYDKFCPFYKSVWMMRNIIHFYNLANQLIELLFLVRCSSFGSGKRSWYGWSEITYTLIKHRLGDLFYQLVSQKFEDPAEGEAALVAKFSKLHDDLTSGFRALEDETR
ncbi:hypothetical protein JRO89_XS09G0041700 [Xanthoceras sorbifolium]|uniref:ATP synthase A/B type C-terminal domain-containing protein n=1 Tax=Xanthoceras sorbifolium TaxID=99658 RepID=A0ABQ8HKP8_9ROSI|nr:hypothetical protein JRO89_XS09G0041700 [Xanthoceras sorbifolium]